MKTLSVDSFLVKTSLLGEEGEIICKKSLVLTYNTEKVLNRLHFISFEWNVIIFEMDFITILGLVLQEFTEDGNICIIISQYWWC